MDEVILIGSEDSENSIVEVEVPKKAPPPVIDVEDDEIILNVQTRNYSVLMAKDIINVESGFDLNSNESLRFNSPDHWTSDMIKFYNDDWGDEDEFIVEKMQDKMDKNPSLWEVARKDLFFMQNRMKRSGIKCWNCMQHGHHAAFCPDPPHIPKCHMCGTPGHLEDSCPNCICLNCGKPSKKYVTCCHKCRKELNGTCSRCQLTGHNFINCSDHWRLFHLTTGTTSIKIPDKNIYKNKNDMWCCNCGGKGHLRVNCTRKKEFGSFLDTLPYVASYSKAFNDTSHQKKPKVIPWKQQKLPWKSNKKDAILEMNPMNKAFRKDKIFKKKLNRFKRKNKRKERKKDNYFF